MVLYILYNKYIFRLFYPLNIFKVNKLIDLILKRNVAYVYGIIMAIIKTLSMREQVMFSYFQSTFLETYISHTQLNKIITFFIAHVFGICVNQKYVHSLTDK